MTVLGSVVIAAHNEEAVIARTLGHLGGVVAEGLVDVVVVCNGCRDRTAEVARGFPGVRVVELAEPSKTGALREGDRLAVPGPRIYLDADIDLTGRAAVDTLRALGGGAVSGRPPRRFDTTGAVWVVRRWYAVRERLTSMDRGLWGAGCYAVSVEGRTRFGEFPEVLADDVFIDGLFDEDEITIVPTDPVIIRTPRTVADQLLILRRKHRSLQQVVSYTPQDTLPSRQQSHLGELQALLRREPNRALDAAVYIGLIALARLRARIGPAPRWERDESSRSGP